MAKFKLNDVRLAFPNLFKATSPRGSDGGAAAFSAAFLLAPTHPQIKAIKAEMLRVATEKWGAKAAATYKAMEAQDKLALHNGDTKAEYDGFEGMLFVNSRNKTRPSVFDGKKVPVDEASGVVYGGCDVNAIVEFWAQDNDFGKRINAQLLGVQFLRDNDSFGGGAKAADEADFDEIEAPAEEATNIED
jgi:hypothetical protein